MKDKFENSSIETKAVHAGFQERFGRAVVTPIFQSSTYIYTGQAEYGDVRYIRLNNTPNHDAVSQKLACLEGCEEAVVTSSGMSAISTALLALVGKDGKLLSQDCLYGGTHHFLHENYEDLGRKVEFFKTNSFEDLQSKLTPDVKAIYLESVSNPLLRIPELAKIRDLAKQKGIITLIDNTFCSPFGFRAGAFGFDIVLHSATKYLNGHSDIVAGFVAGSHKHLRVVKNLLNHLGGCLDTHACFLLERGMKTLPARVRQQNETATRLAKAFSQEPWVEKVIYPGLANHPDHQRAKEWFNGFGSMISFEYKGSVERLDQALQKLKLVALAPSLGGVESLITRPTTTSHSGVSRSQREELGLKDTLVRFSVGLESAEDLLEDFRSAFESR